MQARKHRIAVEVRLKRLINAVEVHQQMLANNVVAGLKVKKNVEKIRQRMMASVEKDRPAVQEIGHEA